MSKGLWKEGSTKGAGIGKAQSSEKKIFKEAGMMNTSNADKD